MKADFRFSSLSTKDLPQVLNIEDACYSNPWSPESFRQILQDTQTFSTLAARSDKDGLVGYVVYSLVVDELHILNIAITPLCRRLGLATFMLIQLHQLALEANCSKSFLEVRESNLAAQNLYKKFSYSPISRRKDYYSDTHEDAIVMVADLKKKHGS